MILNSIEILNFKNIADARLEFSPGVNCLVGRNGMGKSNLLEAIHMLCLARGMSSVHGEGVGAGSGSDTPRCRYARHKGVFHLRCRHR